MDADARRDRIEGALLGVALGDALGLPFEGLPAKRVGRRSWRADRFRLFGRTGFVSDDTEQTALVAQALVEAGGDPDRCARRFRRSMVGWFARLPFGIGGATLRACVRMMLGARRPGVRSAGNGAAMRSGIVGAHFAWDGVRRRAMAASLARLTHTDSRAVEGAVYVAEVAASAVRADRSASPLARIEQARPVLRHPELVAAMDEAVACLERRASLEEAVAALGNTGFVVHTVGLCTYLLARHGAAPMRAIEEAVRAGGDTDTHAAIVGGWVGALHGAKSLPAPLVDALHDGPFGPTHLCALAQALACGTPAPRWSCLAALARNLALYPVILAHALTHLAPW